MTSTSIDPLKVLIVGAGLGGLTLAILLERAGIDYLILEKSSTHRALGSATSLGMSVMPMFEQLGVLSDLERISKRVSGTTVYTEDLQPIREISVGDIKTMTGYETLIMSRIDLHAVLRSHVPPQKILMGKKVNSIQQDKDSVSIRCADDETVYTGHVLIGADGAYSAVRQEIYKDLDSHGLLPLTDKEQLKVCHMSFLGTTTEGALDPEQFPKMKDTTSFCDTMIGTSRPETWRYFTITNNRVCWRVDMQVDAMTQEEIDGYKAADYGPESIDHILQEWRAFKLPINGTIGDLIDATPRDSMSKVVLEEKIFQTWKHGRVVLIGDACHKMLPNFGRGAVNAMMDVCLLANELYELKDTSLKSVTDAFEEYYQERYPTMTQELSSSQQISRVMAGQTWKDIAIRYVLLNIVPGWFQKKTVEYAANYRPQATFLPLIPNRGTMPVAPPKKTSKKYAAIVAAAGVQPKSQAEAL